MNLREESSAFILQSLTDSIMEVDVNKIYTWTTVIREEVVLIGEDVIG